MMNSALMDVVKVLCNSEGLEQDFNCYSSANGNSTKFLYSVVGLFL